MTIPDIKNDLIDFMSTRSVSESLVKCIRLCKN